jgi:hypothetical protein
MIKNGLIITKRRPSFLQDGGRVLLTLFPVLAALMAALSVAAQVIEKSAKPPSATAGVLGSGDRPHHGREGSSFSNSPGTFRRGRTVLTMSRSIRSS